MKTDSGKPLHTTEEAAERLGIQPDTVRKHVQRGNLVPAQTIGRAYIFAQDTLDEFISNRRKRGKPAISR